MSLKQQRQGLRLSASKAIATSRVLFKHSPQEVSVQIQGKAQALATYLGKLEALDTQILNAITDDDAISAEVANIRDFNDTVIEVLAEAQVFISQVQIKTDIPNSNHPDGSGKSFAARAKLPKLEIPPFEGDPICFQEFWDAYKASIHERADLAPVEKFTYLRSLLRGEPLRLVEGFRVTDANYLTAVELLTQRYGDMQAVVFAHVDAILSLPIASGDASSLIETHDKIERHLRSLDSLQPGQDMILYSIVLSKLPRFLKIEAHRRRGSQTDWGLSELRQWLQEELRARDLGERMHKLGTSESKVSPSGSHRETVGKRFPRRSDRSRLHIPTASALVSHSKEAQCVFCNGNHRPESCSKFVDVDGRRTQLRNRCYICLDSGHTVRQCPNKRRSCAACKRSGHHESICFEKLGRPTTQTKSWSTSSDKTTSSRVFKNQSAEPIVSTTASSVVVNSQGQTERTIMQTALVLLENKSDGGTASARLFFDTGASRSFITEAKQRELGLAIARTEWLSVSGFRSTKRHSMQLNIVDLDVKCRDGTVQTVSAAVVPIITCPILKVPIDPRNLAVPEWTLAEPLAESPVFVDIDVLIGMDFYYCFVSPQQVQGGANLWFLSSRVGFLASGRTVISDSDSPETVATMLLDTKSQHSQLNDQLVDISQYWELEQVGVKETEDDLSSDAEAWRSFKSTVEFENDRYQVCWPWKAPTLPLKDNFGLSLGRLKSQLGKLQRSPELFAAYSKVFGSQLESDIIEEAPAVPDGEVYYMPHHAVVSPQKATTKVRVVFDASSKSRKDVASLNECLHRGPVLLEDICGLLLRFRMHPIALSADIEKAFLQVGLQRSQRDATRFLWVRDVAESPCGRNLVVYRYCRVPFGVVSSPFLLAATIRHHLEQNDSAAARNISRDIYVDNLITGDESIEAANNFYRACKGLFSSASMNIREWYSNSSELMAEISEVNRGREAEPKILGLRWNLERDSIRVEPVRDASTRDIVTKRSMLKTLPQLFDPCGYWSPVSVVGKLMIQQMWVHGLDWDSQVPADVAISWQSSLMPDLQLCSSIEIPRYVPWSKDSTLQLHTFCDASQRVCAAAVYLRVSNRKSDTKTYLVMAKTRLASVKQKLTIPKMELVAATLGSRLTQFVSKKLSLQINSHFLWSDSQCVLCWLQAKRDRQRFIQRRLEEILSFSDLKFRYVPSECNPADIPTKGARTLALQKNSLWWEGPSWLRQEASQWPATNSPHLEEVDAGIATTESSLTPFEGGLDISFVDCVIDETRYSTLTKLLRVTSYVFRFLHNLRNPSHRQLGGVITQAELSASLMFWIHRVQLQHFGPLFEAEDLSKQRHVAQIALFRDASGIIRCRGRIDRAAAGYEAVHPALLPKRCHFVDLVVMSCHYKVLHAGVAQTLAQVRHQFWIVHGRSCVKRILQNCRVCRRFEGGSLKTPQSPPLPSCRLAESSPFTFTGVDYLGPLGVQIDIQDTKKVWICLFTCAVVRAVHLEVVEDMSTEHFLLALRRFVASHGCPSLLISDNGRQFHMAAGFLRRKLFRIAESAEFREFAGTNGLEWRFIVEMAPWMGGMYERLVGVVKRSLRKTLGSIQLTLTELRTVLAEIAAVINSRPLTYVEGDPTSFPITPMQLLAPMRNEEKD